MPNFRRIAVVLSGCTIAIFAVAFRSGAAIHRAPLSGTAQPSTTRAAHDNASATLEASISPAAQARVVETYGKLPLTFETNRGQSDKQVKFLARGQGYTLFLTGNEAVLSLRRAPAEVADRNRLIALKPSAYRSHNKNNRNAAVLRMKLVGANPSAPVAGMYEQEGKSNYFIGNDPSQWRTDVSNFSKVRYEDAYPGVDLVYYGNQQQLEYDFVVAPGADPRTISLGIAAESAANGSSGPLHISDNGDLLVPTDGGDVRFHKPVVYQTDKASNPHSIGGEPHSILAKNSIDGHWVLQGRDKVGFEIGAYDSSRPLVIDPALSYSTYLGGTASDGAFGVAIDSVGNAYVTGFTTSTNFPTKNPYQKTLAGGVDTFVSKLNRTGTALAYSTYVGGSLTEYPFGITVDSSGAAYIVGSSGSPNYPTTAGAYQTTCASCPNYPDVFVTKLSTAGNSLVYSTFLGGGNDDRAFGIALDSANDAYIIGWTVSANFPVTAGAFQTTYAGGSSDAFVAELNTLGSALVYSTLLGGNGQDVGFGIAVDSTGNAVATGYTYSTNFPVTAGAFQTTTTTNGSAWITKLNITGTAEIFSTYLGGTNGTSAANSVKVDAPGNVYVTGYTCATDFPITPGAFQTTHGGGCTNAGGDAFVTKLNPQGVKAVFSTYLGGSGDDVGFSLGLDSMNNIYITGRTSSNNYPVTPGAFQSNNAGRYDTIFTILNTPGTGLLYSTYLGGTGVDVAFVMAVDKVGNAYIVGRSYSGDFPITPGVVQATLKGLTNAIVFKFAPGDQAWPTALNFGSEAIGMTTAPLTSTLTNSGTTTLNISSVTVTGTAATDYTTTGNMCGSTLAAGASCSVTLTFTPSTMGTRAAVLAFTDNATNSPQNVTVTGIGSSSSVSLTPASLAYATQIVGTTSASQAATLTNTSTTTVNISSIATAGTFSQTNTCSSTLTAAASCAINLAFAPTKAGPQTGMLTITDDAADGPQTVALSGVGTVVRFSPTSLNFGSQAVGTSTQPQTVTVTDVGRTPLTLGSIRITGSPATSYSIAGTSTCPLTNGTLNAGLSCTIDVVFKPQLKGPLNAHITVTDTGGGSPQNISIAGTGT